MSEKLLWRVFPRDIYSEKFWEIFEEFCGEVHFDKAAGMLHSKERPSKFLTFSDQLANSLKQLWETAFPLWEVASQTRV